MTSSPSRPYKRSWKNYLIYSGYQLRLTAFMVTVVGLITGGLGYWVYKSTRQSTNVAVLLAQGRCPTPSAPMASASEGAAASDADGAALPPPVIKPHARITMTESAIDVTPPGAVNAADATVSQPGISPAQHATCLKEQASTITALRAGQTRILWLLIASGLGLLLILAGYSIKMTHKVGGPLFKLTTYLRHWTEGNYETLWGLRKGDHLVGFFEQFRAGYRRVLDDQKADLQLARDIAARLKDSPHVAEVERVIERKERALRGV